MDAEQTTRTGAESVERASWLRHLPLAVSGAYYVFFVIVLMKRIIWGVGDITDVLVPAMAALPWGALVGFFPGGRNGAFGFVVVLGTLNAASIWAVLRLAVRSISRPKSGTVLGLGSPDSQPGAGRQ